MSVSLSSLTQKTYTTPNVKSGHGTLRIGELGQGLHFSCTGSLRVAGGYYAPGTLQIGSTPIAEPTNVLAVHIGQGAVLVVWQHDNHDAVDSYQIQVSMADADSYYDYPGGLTTSRRAVLHNLPLGSSINIRMRAVGKNSTTSEWVNAKQGRREPIQVALLVRGIVGSTIAAGAVFRSVDATTGQIIEATCDAQLTIQ